MGVMIMLGKIFLKKDNNNSYNKANNNNNQPNLTNNNPPPSTPPHNKTDYDKQFDKKSHSNNPMINSKSYPN